MIDATLTPKEPNVYSQSKDIPHYMTPKEPNVYSQSKDIPHYMTPKESNVYSKLRCQPSYDSFGVERRYERFNFYKHAIHSGLDFQKIFIIRIFTVDYGE